MSNLIQVYGDNLQDTARSMRQLIVELNGCERRLKQISLPGILTFSPYAYQLTQYEKQMVKNISRFDGLVGILLQCVDRFQECESDMISPFDADVEMYVDERTAEEIRRDERDMLEQLFKLVMGPETTAAAILRENTTMFMDVTTNLYSFFSMDFDNMFQDDEKKYHYLLTCMLENAADPNTMLLSWDGKGSLQDVIITIGGEFAGLFENLKACNILSDTCAVIGGVNTGVDGAVNLMNSLMLLEHMDKEKTLKICETYMASDDVTMKALGLNMRLLLLADTKTRASMIIADGENNIARALMLNDVVPELMKDGAYAGIAAGAEASAFGSIALGAIVSSKITSTGMNYVYGLNDLGQHKNEVIYALDAAKASYSVFENAYAAYQQNPTDANLQKAANAYTAYQYSAASADRAAAAYSEGFSKGLKGRKEESFANMAESSRSLAESRTRMAEDCAGRIENFMNAR